MTNDYSRTNSELTWFTLASIVSFPLIAGVSGTGPCTVCRHVRLSVVTRRPEVEKRPARWRSFAQREFGRRQRRLANHRELRWLWKACVVDAVPQVCDREMRRKGSPIIEQHHAEQIHYVHMTIDATLYAGVAYPRVVTVRECSVNKTCWAIGLCITIWKTSINYTSVIKSISSINYTLSINSESP